MSFRNLYLTPTEAAFGEGWSHCDLCCEPDYQDIIDAPSGHGFGVPLRPMYRETGPQADPALHLVVCHKCLMGGDYDAMMAEMVAVAG